MITQNKAQKERKFCEYWCALCKLIQPQTYWRVKIAKISCIFPQKRRSFLHEEQEEVSSIEILCQVDDDDME